ncbi:hypothetical protein K4F52_005423 [Lecanicillium sp. MT-2017a]|nr:hypothetical protein K4F52_005423 [Lecanicillium sp. MT-2017a]
MLSQARGRIARRYAAVLAFFCFAALIWTKFSGDRAEMSITKDTPIHYKPSSYDWSKAQVYNPLRQLKTPPSGTPKQFNKVQYSAGSEAAAVAIGEELGSNANTTEARRRAIKDVFVRTWKAYRKYAWKKDELMPKSRRGRTTFSGWGAQLIDALDALWIMDLKAEFHEAVRAVAKIDWSKTDGKEINVFEVTIRYLGGLIAAYDLSQEPVLLRKAIELGDALYAAFDTPNRLPPPRLDYKKAKEGRQQAYARSSLAEAGTLSLEFTRLSQLTGDPKYYDATERLKTFFYRTQNKTAIPGLWTNDMNFRDENPLEDAFSLGGGSDSMYEYLPKMHALLGGLDPEYEAMATQALEAARDNLLYKPMTRNDSNILFPLSMGMGRGRCQGKKNHEMSHLACFAGGMYALAGRLLARDDFVNIGGRLTAGCVYAYDVFATNLMPEAVNFVPCPGHFDDPCPVAERAFGTNPRDLPESVARVRDARYLLRPEAIESVYYMWRITGDEAWREAAWRMWEGITREAKTNVAYGTVLNVRQRGWGTANIMETFWLGETVKYFYLIFQDESVIDLDEWVLNTEAHPFRRPRPGVDISPMGNDLV